MLKILPIPAFVDNYIWAITNQNGQTAVVDPGIAEPVIQTLEELQLTLVGIIITHHHHDHTGGISDLLAYQPVPVHGARSSVIRQISHHYAEGDSCIIPELPITLKVMEIPGHTLDHLAFYTNELIFCGDTLFMAGCGRLFEGSAAQMLTTLGKLTNFSTNPLYYCGHEYTEKNLTFAQLVEPNNPQIQQRLVEVRQRRQQNLPTVPGNLHTELFTNPFLRINQPTVISAIQQHYANREIDPVKLFGLLRQWKDTF